MTTNRAETAGSPADRYTPDPDFSEWLRVEAGEFAGFGEPGYGKIVLSLSVRSYGDRHSLLTYDIRVTLTDSVSLSRFRRYWMVASPLIKNIHGATLRAIARDAEHAETGTS
ncbi:hypothetical protein [Amycolatopsis alba]|uniref:hypothetical protein n=1 Tax=Amycolatopsis alba TaxID=76020 RepID=UPI000376587D|nr:hypothetical protein [Amycolatopsis alba]